MAPKGLPWEGSPMPQSLADISFHLIFSTKYRAPAIAPALRERLHPYLAEIAKSMKCHLIEAGGMPDHMHLLVSWARNLSMADGMREFKASASRWMHDCIPGMGDFHWQDGYAGFSVSRSQIPMVRHYIQTQEENHRTLSFQDELRAFLQKHEVQFDERYVWD
jgi:REP element-mobilizing transposase RayT